MRIAIGSLQCEGNSLTPIHTKFEDFDYAVGEAMYDEVQVVDYFKEHKCGVVPTIYAHALPGGAVIKKDFLRLVNEARLIYTDQGVKEVVVLNAFSEKLDIAKLFLRFIASDDGGQIMYDYCHAYPACKPLTQLDTTANKSAFADSTYAIAMREGAQFIFRRSDGDTYNDKAIPAIFK